MHRIQPAFTKLALGMVFAACALAWTGCQRRGGSAAGTDKPREPSGSAGPIVAVVEVVTRDVVEEIEMPGSVEGFESAELYAKIGGYLESVTVDIGDEVTKGQVLARLYVPELRQELEQKRSIVMETEARVAQAAAAIRQADAERAAAQAAFEQATADAAEKTALRDLRRTEFERWTELSKTSSIERRKADEARFALDAAQAAVDSLVAAMRTATAHVATAQAKFEKARADEKATMAQVAVAQKDQEQTMTMLQYAEIKAPFDGIVTQRLVHPGAFVRSATHNSAATPLLSVSRVDKVRIALDIPMKEVKWLDVGDRAVFDRISARPEEAFAGRVARIARALNEVSRMMRAEVDVDNPVGNDGTRRLMPGYYGYVTIYLEERAAMPVIPASALITVGSDRCVFVVEDGIVRRRTVTTTYEDGSIVGIGSGLAPGDSIVAAGAGQLQDGQPVHTAAPAHL